MPDKQDELLDWAGVHSCSEDGQPVSVAITDYAPTCPHCGAEFKAMWWIDNPDTKNVGVEIVKTIWLPDGGEEE